MAAGWWWWVEGAEVGARSLVGVGSWVQQQPPAWMRSRACSLPGGTPRAPRQSRSISADVEPQQHQQGALSSPPPTGHGYTHTYLTHHQRPSNHAGESQANSCPWRLAQHGIIYSSIESWPFQPASCPCLISIAWHFSSFRVSSDVVSHPRHLFAGPTCMRSTLSWCSKVDIFCWFAARSDGECLSSSIASRSSASERLRFRYMFGMLSANALCVVVGLAGAAGANEAFGVNPYVPPLIKLGRGCC